MSIRRLHIVLERNGYTQGYQQTQTRWASPNTYYIIDVRLFFGSCYIASSSALRGTCTRQADVWSSNREFHKGLHDTKALKRFVVKNAFSLV